MVTRWLITINCFVIESKTTNQNPLLSISFNWWGALMRRNLVQISIPTTCWVIFDPIVQQNKFHTYHSYNIFFNYRQLKQFTWVKRDNYRFQQKQIMFLVSTINLMGHIWPNSPGTRDIQYMPNNYLDSTEVVLINKIIVPIFVELEAKSPTAPFGLQLRIPQRMWCLFMPKHKLYSDAWQMTCFTLRFR